ncbi:unnamed protein product [Adineta ricciae]|uniref:Uncharacterized protein n=1 Tax=Adineta ricciae TaxID=249248 RepID=A0A816EFP7_ADIRI|nr:unnamed protein product [Adineta ricciae]
MHDSIPDLSSYFLFEEFSLMSSWNMKSSQSYYFHRNGQQSCQPTTIRFHMSELHGLVKNQHGENWQQLAEDLAEVAKVCGNLVRIELSASSNFNNYLYFIISYEEISAAEKLKTIMSWKKKDLRESSLIDVVVVVGGGGGVGGDDDDFFLLSITL